MVRMPAHWMTAVDERILEWLDEQGPGSPRNIADDDRTSFTRPYTNTRCKKLQSYGLVEHLGNGIYQITDDGKAFLDGELNAKELIPDK